jgi:molybdopterin molybdotransferase
MISVQEALGLILKQSIPMETEETDLLGAMGHVLAESIKADRDAPPFHRVTMDGIAIDSRSLKDNSSFKIENIQAAGHPQLRLHDKKNCIEVMTGAILPENTDCVVPYEQIKLSDGMAILKSNEHATLQCIHLKGTDAKKGDILLAKGQQITPAIIGVLASTGISRVKVQKMPKVAVCSTGDELVDIDQKPEAHQIRKSNSFMLQAALWELNVHSDAFHLKDDKEAMAKVLSELVKNYQVVLFSGAVSKGKYDFLPWVLQEIGMKKHIHGVAQRPGKPFLFGTIDNSLIFGFPGNPASTLVCFHTYFKPWLKQYLGLQISQYKAVLTEDVLFDKPLTYHLLVSIRFKNGSLAAVPLQSSGSGDLVHLAQADAVISLPQHTEVFYAGEVYPLNPLKTFFN